MGKKRILLADADAQALVELRQAMGEDWDITAAANGTAALSEMEKEPSDVVIADLDLADVDGTELLNRIQTGFPKAVRFILGREADRERMIKEVLGSHQFIAKPFNSSTVKDTIERAMALDSWLPKNSIRELVARIRTLPTIPSLYLEVLSALKQHDATTEQIGEIIAKDMAMTTKLLQVLNSASFGLSRKITNPTEAVGLLGFETVSSMVMTIKLLSQYDKIKPVYFSIDKLWRHSTEVARMAKQIALWHTNDRGLAEIAFTGGLMHDLGKVILAANFDEQYRGTQSLARKQQLPLWEVEREIFSASHGEIGAYLLGLWGMPIELLEVAAFHEHPSRSQHSSFTPLSAVHIANVFAHELNPDKEGMVASQLDGEYLATIGVTEFVKEWHIKLSKSDGHKTEFKSKSAVAAPAMATARAAASIQNISAPLPTAQLVHQTKSHASNRWVYFGVSAVAVAIVMTWAFTTGVRAKAKNPNAPELSDAVITPVAAIAPSVPTPAPVTKPVEVPPSVAKIISPSTLAAATPSPSNAIAVAVPKEPGFPDVKLQGIFFTDHPSAIINGKMVQSNDKFNGVTVIEIKRSSVTLEYKNLRKTLILQ